MRLGWRSRHSKDAAGSNWMVVMNIFSVATAESFVGQEIALSPWSVLNQKQLDSFARSTKDDDWMHIDVDRAKAGPYGCTIAQGFLVLSMLTHFEQVTGIHPPDARYSLNYGLDRVRFISPVPVNSSIRNRVRLIEVAERSGGKMLTTQNTIEVKDADKPAMVAEWRVIYYL